MDSFGFLKVAAAIPQVRVADCDFNAERIIALTEQAAQRGVEMVAFPELSLTGCTCGDLLLQSTLLDAANMSLEDVVRATRKLPLTVIVGAPLRHGTTLYNCAVVCTQGKILGVVPKTCITAEQTRWFSSGAGIAEETISVAGQEADFGADLTFQINGAEFGVELGEDLRMPVPPSSHLAVSGAKVIFNLAAMPELTGEYDRLHTLVAQQSVRTIAGYVYCAAGFGESSTDLVFAGNVLIAENGTFLREAKRFSMDEQLVVADIDLQYIEFERRSSSLFRLDEDAADTTVIEMQIPDALHAAALDREINPMPFVSAEGAARARQCEEVLQIQSHGLAKRLLHTGCKKAMIGISGGLDSTLTLLATVCAFDKLRLPHTDIICITMPGFGTTDHTHDNAWQLMQGLGVTAREIPIAAACEAHFKNIGLPSDDRSVTYENAQARERTQILMDVANMEGGLVVGTGDLSESALGWATYNGDHMAMYNVNAGVPKTLVRAVVQWAAQEETFKAVRETLSAILETPVSPELLPADADGKMSQKTEEVIGAYELHDFFLYHFVHCGFCPDKILFLAEQAFVEKYDRTTIHRRLELFVRRFFSQQFKRSTAPDGMQVGCLSLSPRGAWSMPSDASSAMWLKTMDN